MDDFYNHNGMKDGKLGKCKECCKTDTKANVAVNKQYYKDYDKKRASMPHRVQAAKLYVNTSRGKEKANRAKIAWIERNPVKRVANVIVGNAVRDGTLLKPSSCEVCHKVVGRINGHHDDYAYPLIVRWLCSKCHAERHKANGEGANAHSDH